jgi:hypothetical protein
MIFRRSLHTEFHGIPNGKGVNVQVAEIYYIFKNYSEKIPEIYSTEGAKV